AVGGETRLLFRGDVVDIQVIGTHEGKEASVGRELRVFFLRGGIGDAREGRGGEIKKKNVAMKDVQRLPAIGVKRVRPRKRLLDFRGRVQGREGSDRFEHVESRVTCVSDGIEPLKCALRFGLAAVVKNGGIVGQPLELWDFRHTGAFFAKDPFRSERRPLHLSPRREGCKEEHKKGREKKSSGTEVLGRHKVFFSWPEKVACGRPAPDNRRRLEP